MKYCVVLRVCETVDAVNQLPRPWGLSKRQTILLTLRSLVASLEAADIEYGVYVVEDGISDALGDELDKWAEAIVSTDEQGVCGSLSKSYEVAQGFLDGDWVSIESPRGKCRQKVKIFDGIDSRVVHAQHGWWFPEEEDGPDHGNWRSNANTLTSMAPPYCSAMGTYQLRALLCKIVKVDESEQPWRPPLPERYNSNVAEVQEWV